MPPSGFNTVQAKMIPDFLASCWTALRAEGTTLGLTAPEALQKEIRNIDAIVGEFESRSLVAPSLDVIRRFYDNVLQGEPSDYDEAAKAAQYLVSCLRTELEAIHVPDAVVPQLSTG